MATHTDYFNLEKPESYENYNIAVFNDNADTIDLQMHNNQVSAAKVMVGATSLADGESGRVPTPHAGDEDKYLKGDGTWATGNSNVEANPSGTPTETLETIGIDNVIYQLPEGGDTEITGDAEGSVISIDDGKLNEPLKACTVDINPVQSGSGTPSPSNIRPISGWTEANITVAGKNLFNKNGSFVNAYCDYSKKLIANNNRRSVILPVKSGESYKIITGGTSQGMSRYAFTKTYPEINVDFPNSVREYVDGQVITVPADYNYIVITLYAYDSAVDTFETVVNAFAVNYPSTDTSYHAYNGTTYNIDLDGTRYGGTLDVTSGVLTVNKVMVDLGTLTWGKYQDDKFYATISNLKIPITTTDRNKGMICSQYKPSETLTVSEIQDQSFLKFNRSENFWIRDSNYNDATAFGTAMSGVLLVYELATPFTIQLTPAQITTLYGNNVIWADSGNMAITYVRDTSIAINDALNQSITPTYSSGTKIADYNVGGQTGAIYVQGAGGQMDTLWTGDVKPTSDSMPTVQLAYPLSGYDYIVVEGYGTYSYYTTDAIYKPVIGRTYVGKLNGEISYCAVLTIINDSNVQLRYWGSAGSNTNIVGIYGVKI